MPLARLARIGLMHGPLSKGSSIQNFLQRKDALPKSVAVSH